MRIVFFRCRRFMSYPSSIPWNCESCESQCSSKIPADIRESIDLTSCMIGSVKPYDHHWLTFLPKPWPSDIKNASNTFIPHVLSHLKTFKQKSILSASAEDIVHNELFIFPDFRKITVDQDDIQEQINAYLTDEIKCKNVSTLPGLSYILVCMHQERDKRCGTIGPLIIEEFKSIIKDKGFSEKVFVFGVSHVGGHKYAGNCIIYHSNPVLSGHWYGRVTPENAHQIFESHIIKGQVLQKFWRGCGKQI